jgi:hypothetical protein
MFKYLFMFACLVLFASASVAQTSVYAGPLFMPGAAVSAGPVLDGSKTSSRFAYCFGALLDIPISESNGLVIGAVYDQRAINFHSQANEAVRQDYTFSYVAIRPELRLSSFLIGFGLGVPASSTYEYSNGTTTTEKSVSVGSINMLAEVRLGTSIAIVDAPASKLNLLIEGSYPLNTIYSNKPLATESKNNGPIATLEIGLAYLFNVSKH